MEACFSSYSKSTTARSPFTSTPAPLVCAKVTVSPVNASTWTLRRCEVAARSISSRSDTENSPSFSELSAIATTPPGAKIPAVPITRSVAAINRRPYGGSRKMISNALPANPRSRTAASASRRHTSARSATSSPIRRRRISVTSFALCSTKTARSAPWRRASIPNAPEPAYRSSTRAPPTRPRRLLKTAARPRASVGRNSSRRRPRTALPFASIAGLADGHRGLLDEPPAHLPPQRPVLAAGQAWIIGQQPARFVACQLQDRDVGQRVGDAQIRQPVLARAQDLPRSPQLQIPLRDDESIVRVGHRLHPLTSGIGRQRTEQD